MSKLAVGMLAVLLVGGCWGGSASVSVSTKVRIVASTPTDGSVAISGAVTDTGSGLRVTVKQSSMCSVVRERRFENGGSIRRTKVEPCGEKPLANAPVIVRAGGKLLVKGVADEKGVYEQPWASLAARYLELGLPSSATILAGKSQVRVGELSLVGVRREAAKGEWVSTSRAASAEVVADYMRKFPQYKADEATALYSELRGIEIEREVQAALSGNDFDQADKLLAEWKTLSGTHGQIGPLEERVANARRNRSVTGVRKRFDDEFAAAKQDSQSRVVNLIKAAGTLAVLGRLAPDDKSTATRKKALERYSRRVVKDGIKTATRMSRKKNFSGAKKLLSDLDRLAPGHRGVKRALKDVERRERRAK